MGAGGGTRIWIMLHAPEYDEYRPLKNTAAA
jgi:hypothetical protein